MKPRAVIYARYSSDLQHDRSIEDQVALCRGYAEREGFDVVEIFADRAKSGATIFGRPGLLEMMEAAKRREFHAVITESFDRLSRDSGELDGIYKRLTFRKIDMRSVQDGAADPIRVFFRGFHGQMYLSDLAAKVKRGMGGRVREGKMQWKPPYGYRQVAGGEPGQVEIVPDEAAIVRRIFQEYVSGLSPRVIAKRLQGEGIRSPSGKPWTHAAVMGGTFGGRRRGIIGNHTYTGLLMFGILEHPLNPETGRRQARAGAVVNRIRTQRPDLRIVDDSLWRAAHDLADGRAIAKNIVGRGRRSGSPQNSRLLTRMVRCSVCDGPMIIGCKGREEVGRYQCSAAHRGQCEHTKSYDIARIERLVVERLREHFSDPVLLAKDAAAYVENRRDLERKARRELVGIQKRLADVRASLMRLGNLLAAGKLPDDVLVPQMQDLVDEREKLERRERDAESETNVITLHPAAIDGFRQSLDTLFDELLQDDLSTEVRLAFRNVIDHVVIHQTPPRAEYVVEVHSRMAALTGVEIFGQRMSARDMLEDQGLSRCDSVVSGPPQVTQSQQPGQVISFGRWRERRAA